MPTKPSAKASRWARVPAVPRPLEVITALVIALAISLTIFVQGRLTPEFSAYRSAADSAVRN